MKHAKRRRQPNPNYLRLCLASVLLSLGLWSTVDLISQETSFAFPAVGPATILPATRLGGASGYGDARDIDGSPAVAYDPSSGRYLVVWMTARNAGSSADGLDVYGVFLSPAGQVIGNEFRITDSNVTARNSPPAVVVGNGEFAVVWTARGSPCQLYVQRVSNTSPQPDILLLADVGHVHSPSVVYNPQRQRYLVAYVAGDDYLPPASQGAQTSDCGNNAASNSRITALEFAFNGSAIITNTTFSIADVNGGTFRPQVAYDAGMNEYLVVWEDRRDAGGQDYRFDTYAQRLQSDLSILESNTVLATGGDYTNLDTSATWTPRPTVVGGSDRFFTAWFSRTMQNTAVQWSVQGSFLASSGAPTSPFAIARMAFAQSHAGMAPTGFLSASYLVTSQEYLLGMTTYLESVWGYFSSALIQRIDSAGQLLRMDGSVQNAPGVGSSVDYALDGQVGISVAPNPLGAPGRADYMVVYSKHAPNQPSLDFDIWGARVQIPAPRVKGAYLPLIASGANGSTGYSWLDATNGGTIVAQGDDTYQNVSLPFAFSFYGNPYTDVYVSSNGFVSFGAGYTNYTNGCLPSASTPNNATYALWTDLVPTGGSNGNIYAKQVDGATFVIEWYQVAQYGAAGSETFEIVLRSDNSISLQYQSVNNTVLATVGVEDVTGTQAKQYFCQGSGSPLVNQLAIRYTTP
jgi:hypothetical protein